MPKSQTRGERLALKSTKIVASQPTSDVEGPEASPTRKSTRVRDNALSQSPGKNMPRRILRKWQKKTIDFINQLSQCKQTQMRKEVTV